MNRIFRILTYSQSIKNISKPQLPQNTPHRNREQMILLSDNQNLIRQIPYLNASKVYGKSPEYGMLNIVTVAVDNLKGFSALVLTGDLQFRDVNKSSDSQHKLIGNVLAKELFLLSQSKLLPAVENIGIILAGDLYCVENLDKRGGLGDVSEVWDSFYQYFPHVMGVLGNHDSIGTLTLDKLSEFPKRYNILHKNYVDINDVRISGISGIVGDPRRPNRVKENEYLDAVKNLLNARSDILITHEAPKFGEFGLSGNEPYRNYLESATPTLIVCGHNHWKIPYLKLKNDTQIFNVDSRCIVLISDNKIN